MLFLGPWTRRTEPSGFSYWAPPDGAVRVLDLRSRLKASQSSGSGGLAVFEAATNPSALDYTELGEPQDAIGAAKKRVVAQRLGLGALATYAATTVETLLWEHFFRYGDPRGESQVARLGVGRGGLTRLYLGSRVIQRTLLPGRAGWEEAREGLRARYRAVRASVVAGHLPEDHHRRWLTAMLETLGLTGKADYRHLIPDDLPDESPLPHSTDVSDDFSGDLSNWTFRAGGSSFSIVAGELVYDGAAEAWGDYNTSLATDDHFASLQIVTAPTGGRGGPTYRMSGSATKTFYLAQAENDNNRIRWFLCMSGTFTELATGGTWTANMVVRAEVTAADSHTIKKDGSAVIGPTTDTNITGNLDVGLYFAVAAGTADNFLGGDNGAGPGTTRGMPFGHRGTAFGGGRTFAGNIR